MNITPATMYWITRFDGISTFLVIGGLFLGISGLICATGSILDNETKIVKCGLCASLLGVIFLAVSIFVPSTKEMAAILMVPAIANNEKVQDVGNKLYDLTVEWLDEFKPSKGQESKHE